VGRPSDGHGGAWTKMVWLRVADDGDGWGLLQLICTLRDCMPRFRPLRAQSRVRMPGPDLMFAGMRMVARPPPLQCHDVVRGWRPSPALEKARFETADKHMDSGWRSWPCVGFRSSQLMGTHPLVMVWQRSRSGPGLDLAAI
jgi:hypothetical protein